MEKTRNRDEPVSEAWPRLEQRSSDDSEVALAHGPQPARAWALAEISQRGSAVRGRKVEVRVEPLEPAEVERRWPGVGSGDALAARVADEVADEAVGRHGDVEPCVYVTVPANSL